jgi:predicted nucleic acid-binding protein
LAALTDCFFDTSVLLGGIVDFGPEVAASQKIMEAVAAGGVRQPRTAWHCCLEFYAVATRLPMEFRLTPAEAAQLLKHELLGRFEVVDLPADARLEFVNSLVSENIAGGRLYDAHIAQTALVSGARTLVTQNLRHFSFIRHHGIEVLSPADFISAGSL